MAELKDNASTHNYDLCQVLDQGSKGQVANLKGLENVYANPLSGGKRWPPQIRVG